VTAAEGLLTALARNWDMVDRALDGLDDAALARCPADQCNSIAIDSLVAEHLLELAINYRNDPALRLN
jgi:hypothetical protein